MTRLIVRPNRTTFICLIILGLFFIPFFLGPILQLKHGFRLDRIIWAMFRSRSSLPFSISHGAVIPVPSKSSPKTASPGTTASASPGPSSSASSTRSTATPEQPAMFFGAPKFIKNGGCAWLIPNKIANYAAVSAYIAALPCEHKTVRV